MSDHNGRKYDGDNNGRKYSDDHGGKGPLEQDDRGGRAN